MQHGEQVPAENGGKKVKELGHFIAKIKDTNMQPYLNKFDKLIKGSQSIDITFINDNPLSIKNMRYNQGGAACYCMEGQTTGKQKIKNLWQEIECKPDCQYLQKNDKGKTACNRIAYLKFFIPKVSTDRLWLMRIAGQETIDNLNSYIQVQKVQGNSLKDSTFTIFLKQKPQTNYEGKNFTNYVLDILKKDEFISQNPNPQKIVQTEPNTNFTKTADTEKVEQKPVITSSQSSANIPVHENIIAEEKQITKQPSPDTSKKTTKKTTANKKETNSKPKKSEENKEKTKGEYDDCYVLLSTYNKTLTVNSQPKQYLFAQFTDMQDNISDIAISPNYADELLECELGTAVRLDIKEVKNTKFAVGLEFVEKHVKKLVA